MMQIVPTQAIPNQGIQVSLANQTVALSIFQTDYGLFMNVASNGFPIVNGVLCEDVNRIVRDAYFGFIGDFVWYDTSGAGDDPIYTGLGNRFVLVYLEASDL
jgi:hypothetical protein